MSSEKLDGFLLNMLRTAPIKPERANVLGVGVHAVNLRSAIEFVEASVASGRRGYVCVTGVHGVMEANRNLEFRRIVDRALLVLPDGMPTVWVGRLQKYRDMRRVFGPDFMVKMCSRAAENGYSHFLYGGKPGVAEQLRANLESRFPGIKIVGTYTPPFRPLNADERIELKHKVASARPDIIWVGLSTPKQEHFMAQMLDCLHCKIMVGVGAAFDIHAGNLKDAPDWIKALGLQWSHRLCQEPARLWKRYLINNSSFVWHLSKQLTGIQEYTLSRDLSPRLSEVDS